MNFLIPVNQTERISVFIIWLFHLCGLIGISFGNKEWFISFTPINLFISFVLLFINQKELEIKNIFTILFIFLIGMIAETLGVNYGIIFGEYNYLDNLGYKVLGVPIMIGVQWIILTFITGSFSSYIFGHSKFKSILFGAVLMVLLDVLIEPVAPQMGFWVFENLTAPIKNYVGWLIISIPAQLVFHYGIDKKEITFSFHLLIVQFLFFGLLNILAL
ncbi:MAG: carotene biosynthesis protein [Flavobacteriaceae bacterium]|nr:carotene biosynthesis protein [Flavobacteriaceae bacterium]|tara:strand:+ start:7904 stop:8554 length:651 start_codon:yes stop_codon:yes gene_type:complete